MPGILDATHGCDARLQAEPFVREDVQRIASGSATDHAVVSLVHLFASPLPAAAPGAAAGSDAAVPRGSHSTVLRI